MYWPIAAPRVYSATNENISRARVHRSGEDAQLHGAASERGAVEGSLIRESDEELGDENALSNISTPLGTPGINPIEQDTQRRYPIRNSEPQPPTLDIAVDRAEQLPLLALRVSRIGHLFAVITSVSLTIWQTKPTAILAVVVRSKKSLGTYGPNTSLLVRPDSGIFVVQTTQGYLITYTLATDPDSRVYKPNFGFGNNSGAPNRRHSQFNPNTTRHERDRILWGPGEGGGVREVSLRFRMVIKVDAGIAMALALDDELIVATQKPPAIQCIRWSPDSTGNQTSTVRFSQMDWLEKKTNVIEMTHDRPMNLSAWITSDGRAYAVQRVQSHKTSSLDQLFKGYCFHTPLDLQSFGVKATINARFSLIAIGCADGSIQVYTAKDYVGNIPASHTHKQFVSADVSGALTCLTYSPDGYCLFAGYENGWAMWSVFGKPGATSFSADRQIAEVQKEGWLDGVKEASWIGNGSEILIIGQQDDRIWTMEMARSAVAGCYSSANISRTLLQTTSDIMVYRGYESPDLTSISADSTLWHTAQIPSSYLTDQWPIRCSVISPDGRYVAVAGRRGLAHYSTNSNRWKTFSNETMENEFQIRGGMCWHRHILIAAVEAGDSFELRLYSRELELDNSLILHVESLPAPVVLISPSGDDSLLVYTYDNLLYHYIVTGVGGSFKLVQVGQIAFHGIVRSPARVRGLSWILPEGQLLDGDPSQDVAVATVLFLVDAKLVLLQPSVDEEKKLKYEMRVISQNVEYYALIRDQPSSNSLIRVNTPIDEAISEDPDIFLRSGLEDSLWAFEGTEMKVWPDIQDILRSGSLEFSKDVVPTASIPLDFYPVSLLLGRGIILGLESDLIQRRDVNFSFFRFTIRNHLFIPQVLRFYLSRFDSQSALDLAHRYKSLKYFSHSLEILLHNVLDEEVDTAPSPEDALLPGVVSFLSSFDEYLDIVVQCTRKTEVRSWRTLFAYLPPPQELFEQSLQRGLLKTAGGYLLILHTFEDLTSSSEQLVRLLSRAVEEGDWDLCKELARFLMALDETGATLVEALELVGLRTSNGQGESNSFMFMGSRLKVPHRPKSSSRLSVESMSLGQGTSSSDDRGLTGTNATDYFSQGLPK